MLAASTFPVGITSILTEDLIRLFGIPVGSHLVLDDVRPNSNSVTARFIRLGIDMLRASPKPIQQAEAFPQFTTGMAEVVLARTGEGNPVFLRAPQRVFNDIQIQVLTTATTISFQFHFETGPMYLQDDFAQNLGNIRQLSSPPVTEEGFPFFQVSRFWQQVGITGEIAEL